MTRNQLTLLGHVIAGRVYRSSGGLVMVQVRPGYTKRAGRDFGALLALKPALVEELVTGAFIATDAGYAADARGAGAQAAADALAEALR